MMQCKGTRFSLLKVNFKNASKVLPNDCHIYFQYINSIHTGVPYNDFSCKMTFLSITPPTGNPQIQPEFSLVVRPIFTSWQEQQEFACKTLGKIGRLILLPPLEASSVLQVRVEETIDQILHFSCLGNAHSGSKLKIGFFNMAFFDIYIEA